MLCLFFFFQAEDGIRDRDVTGVQTCALPISRRHWRGRSETHSWTDRANGGEGPRPPVKPPPRSEERRVGKECRSRGARGHEKKKGRTAEEARGTGKWSPTSQETGSRALSDES